MTELNKIESDIAVIGMAGRFPGADTLTQFWSNLKNSVESVQFFSQDELTSSYIDSE
jgi:acyl transferase domain-containing protein